MISFHFDPSPLSSTEKGDRILKLSVVSSPILGAYFFSHVDLSSPFACPLREFTGIPCPGCGLTRSLMAIAQGHLYQSLSYHILGVFLFVFLVLALLYFSTELIKGHPLKISLSGPLRRHKPPFLPFLGLFLLSYYLTRLALLWQSDQLLPALLNSPLGQYF
ncbi:DUF2752 domain-containing protein [Spirulina subsalsa FACHB-351]|uniref:DUF2752 domain-containing protein n=1 Tax=Spirulina subsalsa FACHB-351 TaxID=234711 RepID=A0ABT3L562_9CYAN|nr:DUF2752 domain-containing protein [Spirulina subsalsa]MCW6036636.1 DUF2752 domain-containing protein [Spirulina subsalsa FACHB-351]